MMLDRGELLKALRAFKRGDFSVRMPLNLTGIDGEIAQTFNDVVELEEAKAAEIAARRRPGGQGRPDHGAHERARRLGRLVQVIER